MYRRFVKRKSLRAGVTEYEDTKRRKWYERKIRKPRLGKVFFFYIEDEWCMREPGIFKFVRSTRRTVSFETGKRERLMSYLPYLLLDYSSIRVFMYLYMDIYMYVSEVLGLWTKNYFYYTYTCAIYVYVWSVR